MSTSNAHFALGHFSNVPGFEFDEGGNNVLDHHLVAQDKVQPWKHHLCPDKAARPVMEIKGVGTKCYVDQGGRGGM